jgi:hypothetical protein
VLGCRLAQPQPALHHRTAQKLSTMYCQARMMVIVHLTPEETRLLVTNSLSVLGQMDNNLLKPHI